MPITCKICNREFATQITNSHLKTHQITTAEYKEKHGELTCAEYHQQLSKERSGDRNPNYGNKMSDSAKSAISQAKKGKTPWNKGVVFEDTTVQKTAVEKRELKYQAGELTRHHTTLSSAAKKKIAESVKKYARQNPEELKNRAAKAIQKKRDTGYDLAFFKGKKHSETSKQLISENSRLGRKHVSDTANKKRIELANKANFDVVDQTGVQLTLRCKQCGTMTIRTRQYFTESKFSPHFCKVCYPVQTTHRSKKEMDLYEFVRGIAPDAIPNYRFSETKHTLDIYVPSANLGIEFNGLYWHSDSVLLDKISDSKKYDAIIGTGIRCLVIMEDEWDFQSAIVKSRLLHILRQNHARIHARQCVVREIDSPTAAKFCDDNHVQGKGRSNARFGLFHENTLVSVMTFSKLNLSRKIKGWELNRFCSLPGLNIPGGASRLLTAFELAYTPTELITYADRRWSAGGVYEKLGFSLSGTTSPGYWYFLPNEGKRIHRFSLRKNKNDDQSLTEYENRIKQGYLRIWDCGHKKYVKKYP